MMLFGYALECSKKSETDVELVQYNEGQRKVIDTVSVFDIDGSLQNTWRFIENHIGSSANCTITINAEKRLFGKHR